MIYCDENNVSLGFLPQSIDVDIDIGDTNDFELSTTTDNYILKDNYRIYDNEPSEYGGIITGIEVNTADETLKYKGKTWRGLLEEYVIRPSSGDDYKAVSGSVHDIISSFITSFGIGDLFAADTDNTQITSFQFDRYVTFLSGLEKMLKTRNRKLKIIYNASTNKVKLSSTAIVDRSSEIELSQDGGINMTISKSSRTVNHLICLGKGELKERTILDLYCDTLGNISKTQTLTGLNEVQKVYDNSSSDDLENDSKKHFMELLEPEKIDTTIENVDIGLHDIISGRERITGTTVKVAVTDKIVTQSKGEFKIDYKVG